MKCLFVLLRWLLELLGSCVIIGNRYLYCIECRVCSINVLLLYYNSKYGCVCKSSYFILFSFYYNLLIVYEVIDL